MAEPTTRFRLIPQNTAVAALENTTKRLAAIAGQSIVSTGVGSEADFGTVDISAGAANSGVLTLLWDVTANGGNTLVETFKLWCNAVGFVEAGSVIKLQPLCGDEGTPVNTEKYVADGVIASYTSWVDMDESEPGAVNVWPTDEGTGMSIAGGVSDDVVMYALYLAIATGEVTGEYKGLDAGKELQFSYRFSYS
jgi:hypothetical protein